jgi:hypothetical protein
MTSASDTKPNRANARTCTGPKTAYGKTRAAQNARRHGLSLSVLSDSTLSTQVESIAQKIVGGADSEVYEFACRVAEAQVDLIRIRQARHDLLARNISDPHYQEIEVMDYNTKLTRKIARSIGMLTPIPPELMAEFRSVLPQGPQKVAAVLSDLSEQLMRMDRYERRALSRRKFAIRALDALRRQAAA